MQRRVLSSSIRFVESFCSQIDHRSFTGQGIQVQNLGQLAKSKGKLLSIGAVSQSFLKETDKTGKKTQEIKKRSLIRSSPPDN